MRVCGGECRKVRLVPKFKEYDRDGNGYISLEEASVILQNKPFNFPADKVVVLLRKFDKDGNGKLDIDEFADFYAEAKATSVSPSYASAIDRSAASVNRAARSVGWWRKQICADGRSVFCCEIYRW